MSKYEYEYEIQGQYGYGWECVTTEATLSDARRTLRDYHKNEPQYAHRIQRVRVASEEVAS